MDYEKDFIELYRDEKIFRYHIPLKLHCSCDQGKLNDNKNCWYSRDIRRTPAGKYQCITRPYVGKYYKTTRALVLGMNHRDNEDYRSDRYLSFFKLKTNYINDKAFYAEEYWIGKASKAIQENDNKQLKKRINNTPLYAALFTYAVTLVGILNLHKNITGDISTSVEQSEIAEYIAWTQTIKCNPKETRNDVPTPNMWKKCPSKILSRELEILKPKYILVLGLTDNFTSVRVLLQNMGYKNDNNQAHYKSRKPPNIKYWGGHKRRSKIHLIGVPHPCSRGNKQTEVAKKLKCLLQRLLNTEII